jgi:hypothetical protein
MMRLRARLTHALLLGLLGLCSAGAHAETVLNDWCLNINGDSSSACNGSGPLPSNVDASAFDLTLNSPPGTPNTLGTLRVTLGPGNSQFAIAYFDYDVNWSASAGFQEYGSVHGTPPPGVTFEMDDPSSSAIFGDFLGHALTNLNNVPVGSAPPCCDVSWAIGLDGINVPNGSSETLLFSVTNSAPSSGFYLAETNRLTNESLYLTVSPAAPVPLPGALWLLASGIGLLGGVKMRRARTPQTPLP